MIKSNVYILVPNKHRQGGVYNYYSHARKYLSGNYKYIFRGEKKINESKFFVPIRIISDYFFFFQAISRKKGALVINSSLGNIGFFRDGIYCFLSPRECKMIVFFRGWSPEFEKKIETFGLLKLWLSKTFLKADHIIVLSSKFKNKLVEWGYKKPISIETTLVDESMIEGENIESLSGFRGTLDHYNILYLGNISKAKGIWALFDAMNFIDPKFINKRIECTFAGEGNQLEFLRTSVLENSNSVAFNFPGYVKGMEKKKTFKNAHLYVFASAHDEGMPNSLLEAMALGLPVITTCVGGISDFFEDGKMGYFLETTEPKHIAEKITYLLQQPELMKEMSEYNYRYAKEHFYAGKVVCRLDSLVKSVVNNMNASDV
jgi:glycosyltransferase involved in cell wall biosynthesis